MKKTFCLCFGFHLVSWFMKKSLLFLTLQRYVKIINYQIFLLKKNLKNIIVI